MNREGGYIAGGHWATCDICGFTYRNDELKKNSDGLIVCPEDYEDPHPQESLRLKADNIRAKHKVRSPSDSVYVDLTPAGDEADPPPSGTFDNSL